MNTSKNSNYESLKISEDMIKGYFIPVDRNEDKKIDLFEKLVVLRKAWKECFLFIGFFTSVAFAISYLISPIYRADALLAPVNDQGGARTDVLSSQFGGLAALAGVNLVSNDSSVEESLATLKSRALAYNFITNEKLMPILFENDWNSNTKNWKNPNSAPSIADAYMKFKNDIFSVNLDKKTGLVTLSMEWKDPILSAEWVNKIVSLVNSKLRFEAIDSANRSIAYLEKELSNTSVVDVQQSIYKLIEVQTKTKMLANTREEYAFRVIDKAVIPEKKIRPNRKLIIILGLLLGSMFGVFFILLLDFFKKKTFKSFLI